MDTGALLGAFGLIFLAELGDKTQLTAMALATRHPWRKVFLGVVLAFGVLNVAAVTVGAVLLALIPLLWIRLGTAVLFAVFGISCLRAQPVTASESEMRTGRPLATAFLMILIAELGDKTQLATAGLAAEDGASVEVFIGSSVALWTVSLLGIFFGRQLTRWMPLQRIQQAGGILFLAFASMSLYQAFA